MLGDTGEFEASEREFRRAIRLSPSNARAHYLVRSSPDSTGTWGGRPLGDPEGERTGSLRPPRAYRSGAEREFRTAIELGPSDARAHFWYSILLVALGRGEEALREAQRAKELDPFAPRGLTAMLRYATFLMTGQRPHRKLPVAERFPILKGEPGEPWARAQNAYELADQGQCAEARAEILRAQQLAAESRRMLAFVASVYWLCGERTRARALVNQMKRRPDAYDHGLRIAQAYAIFGEKDSAFVWLGRQRWTIGQLSGISADRRMDQLRSDPRYPELLRRLGIR